jgi:hypothetical protein
MEVSVALKWIRNPVLLLTVFHFFKEVTIKIQSWTFLNMGMESSGNL